MARDTRQEPTMTGEGNPISFVYVIGPAAQTAPVKIGFTANSVESRLAALSTGSPVPLTIIAAIRASATTERKLHKLCDEWRLHGEWFERKDAVKDVIRDMLVDPDSMAPLENARKTPYWVPDEVAKCPAADAIWMELCALGVPMRGRLLETPTVPVNPSLG